MHEYTKHVGLDVHAKTIEVAIGGQTGECRPYGRIVNTATAVRQLLAKISRPGDKLCFWYEAGPTGYSLCRLLMSLGHDCHVVAPSLVPRKAGDRIKNDRRDALNLARLGRAGELTAVHVPTPDQEALRDLTRCREDAKAMQRAARQQLGAYLLRCDRQYDQGSKRWTKTYYRWLAQQKFDSPAQQSVLQQYMEMEEQITTQVEQLTKLIEQEASKSRFWSMINALKCLRGIDVLTATIIAAELGDLNRFRSPRQLMAYLGLVPSEHSSGQSRRLGGITKTGNGHVRRVLVESAWCYRHAARNTKHMKQKLKDASEEMKKLSWKAQKRLCARYQCLTARGKESTKAVTAVARELAGFVWAMCNRVALDTGSG
jgi:transposase